MERKNQQVDIAGRIKENTLMEEFLLGGVSIALFAIWLCILKLTYKDKND